MAKISFQLLEGVSWLKKCQPNPVLVGNQQNGNSYRLKNKSYIDRLIYLSLPTLKYRRLRGDMIKVFKITHNIYDTTVSLIFLSTKELTPEATTINCKINLFIVTYESTFSLQKLQIFGTACLIQSLVLALLMHLSTLR